jgi:signal transduction histidine kinase
MSQLRDEERRSLARELHDSVGQLIAAIRINTGVVDSEADKLSSRARKCLLDNVAMIEEVSKEIRTISYLLHPPMLEELGLPSALRWLVDGFAERSKINARLDISPDFIRLPHEVELAIFRVVQECLTNIHRHSGSPTATIRLTVQGAAVNVGIEDAGKGMAIQPSHCGVGLRGMQERLRLLGGTLDIHSDGHGTRVTAVLPFPHDDSTVITQNLRSPISSPTQPTTDAVQNP